MSLYGAVGLVRRLFNLHPPCSASAMFAYSHMPSLGEIRRKYNAQTLINLQSGAGD